MATASGYNYNSPVSSGRWYSMNPATSGSRISALNGAFSPDQQIQNYASGRPAPVGTNGLSWGTAANGQPSYATLQGGSGSSGGQNGQGGFVSYTNPYGNSDPGYARSVNVAGERVGAESQSPSLSSIASSLYNPNLRARGTPTPGAFNQALATKQGLTMSDFGIPDSVKEQMKVQEATPINAQAQAQKEAARRMLAKAGILNDSAAYNSDQEIEGGRASNIANSYNNIDIQSGLQANQQRLANLNEVMSGALEGGKFTEAGRQFNVGAELDKGRLDRATQQWLETAGQNRSSLQESIAEFLENYDLERLKASQGLIAAAPETSKQRLAALQGTFGGDSSVGFGGFSSGGFGGGTKQ